MDISLVTLVVLLSTVSSKWPYVHSTLLTCGVSCVSFHQCVTNLVYYYSTSIFVLHAILFIIGGPFLRLDVCSESKVTFTCTVNESEALNLDWEVDFISGQRIEGVTIEQSDSIGQILTAYHGTGVEYHFNLTSKSPLTTTMTTSMPTDLSGATVSCFINDQNLEMTKLTLPGKLACHMTYRTNNYLACSSYYNNTIHKCHAAPLHPTLNITVITTSKLEAAHDTEAALKINVNLHWNVEENNGDKRVNLNTSYMVTVTSESLESNRTIVLTSNNSIQLTLFGDQDYNISVVASTCAGISEPAEIHITTDVNGTGIIKGGSG